MKYRARRKQGQPPAKAAGGMSTAKSTFQGKLTKCMTQSNADRSPSSEPTSKRAEERSSFQSAKQRRKESMLMAPSMHRLARIKALRSARKSFSLRMVTV